MVRRRCARPGHSLPELIVAVTFLATTLVAVGGTAVLGARWTARGTAAQEAVRIADGVLDSLAAVSGAGDGAGEVDGFRVTWSAAPAAIRVEVGVDSGPPLVVLKGIPVPRLPALPDAGPP